MIQGQQTVLPWWGERWHLAAFIMFLSFWGVCVIAQMINALAPDWMTTLVLVSALTASLVTLGRQLPLQNVILIGIVVLVAGVGWVQFSDSTDSPFEWHRRNWRAVVLWTVVILNARGVAQFFLQRRRGTALYGWELIGGTAAVFTGAVAFLSEAILHKELPVLLAVSFFGAAGLFIVLLPLLMNKRPVEPPVSWQPIVVLPLLLLWAYLPRT